MSESPYVAMREFIRVAVELEVRKALETRSIPEPKVIEGPPGKNGVDGKDGTNGKDGRDGVDGKPGERGADGIATRVELEEIIEDRLADIQVRTFADTYQGVYEPNRTYNRGLLTTWGGSLWLSQSETKTKPGESPDWKLVVKKGSDGRK